MPPSIPLSPSQPRGEATAAASPAVAMMQAAQRKAQQEAEERARKEQQEVAQEARAQEAMQINREQNARAAAAAAAEQAQTKRGELAKTAAGDIAVSAPAYGVQWDKTPDYVRQDFQNRYGAEALADAPKQWDASLQKPEPEDNTSPRELAAAGGDPTGLSPADRNKAMARQRMAEREAALDKERTMPASSVEKLTAFQEIADLSDAMAQQIGKLKDSDIGPLDAGLIPKAKNFLGMDPEKDGGILGAANSPGFNDAMSTYNTVRNIILRARSGGAVTPSEADRLLSELGDPVKRAGTFKSDIANFVRNRRADVEVQREALKTAGYRVPERTSDAVKPKAPGQPQAPTGLPAAGEVRSGYRFKGGNPADKNNWEPVNP